MKYCISTLLILLPALSQSQPVDNNQLLQQLEQHQSITKQQLVPIANDSSVSAIPLQAKDNRQSSICFPIGYLKINRLGHSEHKSTISGFSRYMGQALSSEGLSYQKIEDNTFKLLTKERKKPCLGINKINNISIELQNKLIAKGFVTSRVLVPQQSLKTGRLVFTLAEGLLDEVVINSDRGSYSHKAMVFTAFPSKKGEVLNLRALEQGLENLRRLPTVTTGMNIVPSQQQNASNVEVKWQQRRYPLRLNFSVDDSGGTSTGKYLGTVSAAWDNPLRLNDILSASYTHNLSSGKKARDAKGNTDKGKTYSYSLGYSVPVGYWLLDMGVNHYFYDQAVAGVNRNYHYTGESDQTQVDLSRVIYRDSQHKIIVGAGAWYKENHSYIDDAEIDVQHRKTAGWKAKISTRSYFSKGTLTTSLNYKRGTRAFGAIAAPEELFNEGMAKARIWTANIHWQMPFKLGNKRFSWQSQLHGQLNKTDLTPQEMFSIGGRYNVRGFSGEKTLSAERGWYLRNDFAWQYHDSHQLYLGLDIGRVSGKSAKNLPGLMLSGAVLGVKGQFKKAGNWYYDIFVGKPVKQPDSFNADPVVSGFYLNYSL